jgi:hypothetical protein
MERCHQRNGSSNVIYFHFCHLNYLFLMYAHFFKSHMASPFPLAQPEDEQSVIKPAVEGTLSK